MLSAPHEVCNYMFILLDLLTRRIETAVPLHMFPCRIRRFVRSFVRHLALMPLMKGSTDPIHRHDGFMRVQFMHA